MEKLGVWIIEFSTKLRSTFKLALAHSELLHVVEASGSIPVGIADLKRKKANVIIIDVDHPGALTFIQNVVKRYPLCKILICSDVTHHDVILNAFKVGVSGYISKACHLKDFVLSLEKLADGGTPLSIEASRVLVGNFHRNQVSNLTPRQKEVLLLIAQGHTSRQIASLLKITVAGARTHIHNVYRKLHVTSKAEAIRLARQKKFI